MHGWEQQAEREGSCHTAGMWSPHGVCSCSFVLCRCRAQFLTPLRTVVSHSLNARHNEHVMPSQRGSARRRKGSSGKIVGLVSGRAVPSAYVLCVPYAWPCQRPSAVTKVCSWNPPSALASSLWAFRWVGCWQTCRRGLSQATEAVLAVWVRFFQKLLVASESLYFAEVVCRVWFLPPSPRLQMLSVAAVSTRCLGGWS